MSHRPAPLSTSEATSSSTTPIQMQDRHNPVSPLDPISPWPPEEPAPGPADLPSAKEVYGSLAVLLTYLAYAAYLAWAFAPPAWLDAIGWTWYPDREWAIIVPCWLMVLVWITYWSYAALMVFLSPSFSSPSLITGISTKRLWLTTDRTANIPPCTDGPRYYWKFADPQAVPEPVDLPIDLVNRVLYPPRRRPGRAGK